MDRLESFKEWVSKGKRTVNIEIESLISQNPRTKIWVYDYDLCDGQFISDISEINLEETKEIKDQKEFERLKLKYNKEINNE